jgi:hypothetical protein
MAPTAMALQTNSEYGVTGTSEPTIAYYFEVERQSVSQGSNPADFAKQPAVGNGAVAAAATVDRELEDDQRIRR